MQPRGIPPLDDWLRYGMSRNLTFRSIFVRRNEAQREGCGTPIALRFKSNPVDGYRTSDFKGILETLNHLDGLVAPVGSYELYLHDEI